ncbi:MAG TPA: alpha/beta hydrolase-fold protein [Kofleriaceae bacterium]|nr:alpha/beta hydrolase-fold protein [Kofleriaceae bacterium]
MRGIICFVVATLPALGACGDDPSTTITCGDGTEGALTATAPLTVTADGAKDLRGAAIAAGPGTTIPSTPLTIKCAVDIVPAGYVALGPAVTFGADGTWSDRPFFLTLPYKAARLPKDAERRHVRIVAKRDGQTDPFFAPVSNRKYEDDDRYASRVTFKAGELTTYQVVAELTAGTKETQQFGWRAIVGISMGGNAAMSIALRHPDKFDIFADLGGEPGPSMVYSLSMVSDFLFGGFCTVDDEAAGRGNVGQLCPNKSTRKDQFEIEADYEHMITQDGDGVGLTLKRNLYMKASRDLARALSNPALYNPMNPYVPPGVSPDFIEVDAATRCANPTKLDDFYDREFNPTGSHPVITFCDGGDGPALGLAVFDPNLPQTNPAELLLAVDLNNNGKRDSGEPVITNAYEPFSDVGTDSLADKDEPGYDPVTNPDPNRDDYHSLRNPLGTEKNGNYESGEPFVDAGLDGVMGTCQAGQTPPSGTAGCYDFGEGNSKWDLSPNVARWYESDVIGRLDALDAEQRRHMSMWFDAGIRDFLNASVSANAGVGQAMAKYSLPFGVYDNFSILDGGDSELAYDFEDIDWTNIPKNGYLRYGDPDATPDQIKNGDGRHVGTANQIIYRARTAFAWINRRWPDGDLSDTYDGGQIIKDLMFTSPTTGRVNPFGVFLPPGYNKPENATKTYPVVYFLHGYGQEPKDLVDLSSVFALNMIATNAIETRFQKYIIVYVDGRCRPNIDGTPVDPTGDRCEGGTFYLDAPLGGLARMETNMLDLMDYIDANYRTKPASSAQVVD